MWTPRFQPPPGRTSSESASSKSRGAGRVDGNDEAVADVTAQRVFEGPLDVKAQRRGLLYDLRGANSTARSWEAMMGLDSDRLAFVLPQQALDRGDSRGPTRRVLADPGDDNGFVRDAQTNGRIVVLHHGESRRSSAVAFRGGRGHAGARLRRRSPQSCGDGGRPHGQRCPTCRSPRLPRIRRIWTSSPFMASVGLTRRDEERPLGSLHRGGVAAGPSTRSVPMRRGRCLGRVGPCPLPRRFDREPPI